MKKLLLLLIFAHGAIFGQQKIELDANVKSEYADYFRNAYMQYPAIPRGILEAVAYGNTHIFHVTHVDGQEESCIGLPMAYGVMGLTLDGKDYFKNNLVLVSNLSGISVNQIIESPSQNILAYAAAFNSIMTTLNSQKNEETKPEEIIFNTLTALSELPAEDDGQLFALNTQLYSYFWFLNQPEFQQAYNFPNHNFDLPTLFGEENYLVLSSDKVVLGETEVSDSEGNVFKSIGGNNAPSIQSTDYAPALWNQAATCNFSSRSQAITAITIHDVEGSYASCISWFKNCNAGVSAHYVIRSSDGQVTQMVLESKKAWHVGTENGYTIGIEHEGYAAQTGWYTTAMMQSSANLVKDICASGYGISPTTAYNGPSCHCHSTQPASVKIKGHQHNPNTGKVDPGANWNWVNFYNLINNNTMSCGTPSSLSASSISSSGATLNWSAISGAQSYTIVYTSNSGSVTTTSTTNSLNLTGLTPSTQYQFKVQAVCGQSNTGTFSGQTSFTTTATSTSNSTITIGTATTPYSAHPFSTVYMDQRVQYIIKKSELVAAGWSSSAPYLKSLAFYVSSAAPQSMGSFKITVAHTTGNSFTSTTFLNGTNATTVYTGTVTATQGWNTFNFTNPFNYNGSSNLLITICWDNSSFTVNSAVNANSYSSYVALYYRADLTSSGPCNKTTGTRSYFRPNAQLEFSSTTTLSMPQGLITNPLNQETENQRSLEIYPNPLEGGVLSGLLSDSDQEFLTLKIYDLMGRELFSEELLTNEGSFSINLSKTVFPTGIYNVIGFAGEERFAKRLVIK